MTTINLYTVKSDWHKTSPVQERLELSQFAIEEKQSYSNFQEIDSCTIDLKVSFVSVCDSLSETMWEHDQKKEKTSLLINILIPRNKELCKVLR